MLLGNGADVHIRGGDSEESALHIAARIDEARGDKCSKILLKSGADPNLQMGNGCSPVHIAAQSGNRAVNELSRVFKIYRERPLLESAYAFTLLVLIEQGLNFRDIR